MNRKKSPTMKTQKMKKVSARSRRHTHRGLQVVHKWSCFPGRRKGCDQHGRQISRAEGGELSFEDHPEQLTHPSSAFFLVSSFFPIQSTLLQSVIFQVDNGYSFRMVPVQIDSSLSRHRRPTVVMALTCVADKQNELYLGPDDLIKMAREIATAKGCAGPNCE